MVLALGGQINLEKQLSKKPIIYFAKQKFFHENL
jgi:hypothetical protein